MQETLAPPPVTSVSFQPAYGHLIGGKWTAGNTGETIALRNPATGEELSRVAAGDAVDAERAVAAAYEAFPRWSQSSPRERQDLILALTDQLQRRLRDYAELETLNNGKPLAEALHFDVPQTIEILRTFAGSSYNVFGGSADTRDATVQIHREPIGVCAQIIPWNVPLIMMASKIGPALATGNTIVLKPSEIVSLSVMEFFHDVADIVPPGVINVLTGRGPDVGEALVTDRRVRKVSFTGSKPTARALIRYAAVNIIPQSMELGGKSAMIICDDGDLDAAAEAAAMSTVLNKGEVCVAATRLFVHRKVRDKFLQHFSDYLDRVQIGDPRDLSTRLGAAASRAQFDRVLDYIGKGRDEGARILRGGGAKSVPGLPNGLFIEPTIFENVTNDMIIARDEIFGPVVTILDWEDEEQVIREANDSEFGLAAGLWTKDLARAHRMARALNAGSVWINRYFNLKPGVSCGPFHGSGFGRELGHEAAIEHYTHTKAVTINLDEGPIGIFDHR